MPHTPRHRKVTTRKSEKRERDLAARRTRRAKREAEREGQDKRTDPDVRGGTGTTTRKGRARNLTRLERLQRGRARRADEERRKREGRGLGGRAVRTGKPTKQASTTPPSPPGFGGDLPPLPFGPAGGSPDQPNLLLTPTEELLRGMMPQVPQGGASTGGPGDLVNAQAGLPQAPPSPPGEEGAPDKPVFSTALTEFARENLKELLGRDPSDEELQNAMSPQVTQPGASPAELRGAVFSRIRGLLKGELGREPTFDEVRDRVKRDNLLPTFLSPATPTTEEEKASFEENVISAQPAPISVPETTTLGSDLLALVAEGITAENKDRAIALIEKSYSLPPLSDQFGFSAAQGGFVLLPGGAASAEEQALATQINQVLAARSRILDAIEDVNAAQPTEQEQEAGARAERGISLAERGQEFEESQAAFVGGQVDVQAAAAQGRQYEGGLRAAIQQFDIENTGAMEAQLAQPLPQAPPGIVWNASGGVFDVRSGFGGGITPEVQTWITQMTPVYQARDRAQAMLTRIQALKIDLQAQELQRASQEAAFRAAMATNDIDSAEEARAKQILAETQLTRTRNRLLPAEFIMRMLENPVLIGMAKHMGMLAQLESIVGIKLPSVPEIAGATDTIPLPEEWNALNAIEKQLRLAIYVSETGASVEDFMKQIAAQAPSAAAEPVQVETL